MKYRGSASGQALVPVLFVVLLLAAVAVVVSNASRREARAARTYLEDAQAYAIARGAVFYAAAQLQDATGGGATYASLSAPPDTDANGWTQMGEGWYKLEIVDTASRVNINTASAQSLIALPGLNTDPSLALAIVDYRDTDETPGNYQGAIGAESDFYQSLPLPYMAKNLPFDTVDELMLVRGMTQELLYGALDGNTGSAEPGTAVGRSRQFGDGLDDGIDTSGSAMPLRELLTTYSKELNVATDGTPRMNVKTASAADMQTQLGISAQLAQRLVQSRGQNGATLTSIASLLDVTGFTRQIMQQIGDKVTVTSDQFRNGVLNINTASAEALASIPNVDQAVYSAVIDARQGGTVFNGLNDMFLLTGLNRQQLQALVDNVCTKSSVFLVRVKVRTSGSDRVYAAQALVELAPPAQPTEPSGTAQADTAQPQAKVLQFREVPRSPGWRSWVTAPTTGGTSVQP